MDRRGTMLTIQSVRTAHHAGQEGIRIVTDSFFSIHTRSRARQMLFLAGADTRAYLPIR